MSQEHSVTIPAIPAPLRWHGTPQSWELSGNSVLTASAGERTDWFIDPEGTVTVHNAPALLFPVQSPCQLKAYVSIDHLATYDAGVLTVYQSADHWAKLCLELSPQGQVMIVSVVTKGLSDDCNSLPITGNAVYLRLSKLEQAYAFHYSLDGATWHMVRYFTLGAAPDAEIGFLVQSPTGAGCTASFSKISYLPSKLNNIRSGE